MRKLGLVLLTLGLTGGSALGLAACGSSSGGGKEGGTLEVSYASFPDYLDPQLSYSAEGWTALYNTYIPLLTYAHANGAAGSEVVPGLAESLPKITKGGKTYELTLRDGLKYSDGTPVKASDFKSSVERLFEIESPGSSFFEDIVGAEDFLAGKASSIEGIKADDETGEIVIDLRNPRGSFTSELATPFVAVVPSGTPAKSQTANPPPATGPYEIVSSDPGKGWSYARNPQWEKNNSELMPDLPSGHVDKIDVTVVRNQATQVNDVIQGKTDWMFDPLPADRVAEIKQRFEGTQYQPEPSISTYFFWMNTTEPPFDDVEVRQAVNYAIDPAALERIYAGEIKATQQILPPDMPGYEKFTLYPHDMTKAKALIKEANPSDREVTVWTDNLSPNDDASIYYQGVLEELGFDAKLKVLNGDNYFNVIGNLSTPNLDTGWANFFQDYPHPNDFFNPLLNGESIAPVFNTNLPQIDVPELNEEIDRLGEKQLDPTVEEEYAALDEAFMKEAPMAPYGNRTLSLFVSSDIDFDEVIWNPTFSGDLTSFQFE